MTRDPRPRDSLGRPLARDSGVPVEPDPQPLPPEETLEVAQQLLDEGRAFRAHEVFEALWKATNDAERELWRGLAQLAVGITHAQRGNPSGSVALLRRAARTLLPWEREQPYAVDVAALRAWAETMADAPLPPASTVLSTMPRLRRPRSAPG